MNGYLIIAGIVVVAILLGFWRLRGRHGVHTDDSWDQQHGDPPADGWTFGSKGVQPEEFGVYPKKGQDPRRFRSP